jgi:hypothetical protein
VRVRARVSGVVCEDLIGLDACNMHARTHLDQQHTDQHTALGSERTKHKQVLVFLADINEDQSGSGPSTPSRSPRTQNHVADIKIKAEAVADQAHRYVTHACMMQSPLIDFLDCAWDALMSRYRQQIRVNPFFLRYKVPCSRRPLSTPRTLLYLAYLAYLGTPRTTPYTLLSYYHTSKLTLALLAMPKRDLPAIAATWPHSPRRNRARRTIGPPRGPRSLELDPVAPTLEPIPTTNMHRGPFEMTFNRQQWGEIKQQVELAARKDNPDKSEVALIESWCRSAGRTESLLFAC